MTEQSPVEEMPIEQVPLDILMAMQTAATDRLERAKSSQAIVVAEVARRFADSAKSELQQAGKTHGSITLPLQDGLAAKADVRQTVDWDSDKLMEIAKTMPWDRVTAMFKIKFSISETVYKGLAAASPETRKAVDEARTVKFSEPSIKLVREG